MGKHTQTPPTKKPSIADTLLDAERDHYLDCPNAEPTVRASAFLLDVFLFFLASSALQHLAVLLMNALMLLPSAADYREPFFFVQLFVRRFGLILIGYVYFIETVRRFGGTPAKLLLGLRVVDADNGDLATAPSILVREAIFKPLSALSIVGIFVPLMRKDKKMPHDLLSHTVVKKIYPVGIPREREQ